jgi:hypothetical protein
VIVLRHEGDPGQAAAVISWPTGGGTTLLRESRQLDVLSQVFALRLMGRCARRPGPAMPAGQQRLAARSDQWRHDHRHGDHPARGGAHLLHHRARSPPIWPPSR